MSERAPNPNFQQPDQSADPLRAQMERLAPAFAKAFSAFAFEFTAGEHQQAHRRAAEILQSLKANETDPQIIEKLERATEKVARGEPVVLTEDSPAEAAASRLKRLARTRGVTQTEIAKKLGVTPAVINRVFKNPDRSKLSTLRRIAAAMGATLHEIID